MRSAYLHAFVGGTSNTRFKERLGDLFHEGYIDRPAKQWEFAHSRCMPVVYEIGKGARRVLCEHAGGENGARTFLAATAHRQFAHSVLICECLASMELATLKRSGLRFISWPEILARAPEPTRSSAMPFQLPRSSTKGAVVPDGLFGLEYQSEGKKAFRFFALEIDRGTMPIVRSDGRQTSYRAKLAAYWEIIALQTHKTHLGVPNLFVLTITIDSQRLADALRKLPGHAGAPLFLFKAVEPLALTKPFPDLLFKPWERASLLPLQIGELR